MLPSKRPIPTIFFAPCLALSLFAILLIVAFIFSKDYQLTHDLPKSNMSHQSTAASITTSSSPRTIKNLLRVQKPEGWGERTSSSSSSPYGSLELTSPDLVQGAAGGQQTNAVVIRFDVTLDQEHDALDRVYQSLYDEVNDVHPAGAATHDLTRTTVAGLPAVSWYYDFEGHWHTYSVQDKNNMWNISISSPEAKYEQQHVVEIVAVLA
jgi:hypothetical protein